MELRESYEREMQRRIEAFGRLYCDECGVEVTGQMRTQNYLTGAVHCLEHGLGVTRSDNQP